LRIKLAARSICVTYVLKQEDMVRDKQEHESNR